MFSKFDFYYFKRRIMFRLLELNYEANSKYLQFNSNTHDRHPSLSFPKNIEHYSQDELLLFGLSHCKLNAKVIYELVLEYYFNDNTIMILAGRIRNDETAIRAALNNFGCFY